MGKVHCVNCPFSCYVEGLLGGTCSLEINWLVSLFPHDEKKFFMFPVPQYFLCFPVPLKIWPLFPCSPEINVIFLCSQKSWEGLYSVNLSLRQTSNQYKLLLSLNGLFSFDHTHLQRKSKLKSRICLEIRS